MKPVDPSLESFNSEVIYFMLKIKKINPVQSKNRARPMAARLKKKKPRAEQEPRSAHGRAVKKPRAEQEPRSAHGRAVKKI